MLSGVHNSHLKEDEACRPAESEEACNVLSIDGIHSIVPDAEIVALESDDAVCTPCFCRCQLGDVRQEMPVRASTQLL